MDDIRITSDISKMDLKAIHHAIAGSYWAKDIPYDTFYRSLKHSLCFAILDDQQSTLGFARVITDYATFAYLGDVFVFEAHRGLGLSKRLMDAIVAHPELQGLRRFVLATSDAHGLYEQYGFTSLNKPDIMMEIWQPGIYQQKA